jgi:hypothetical protein
MTGRRQVGGVQALAVGLAGAALSADVRAEEGRAHAHPRVLPANALPPLGAPFEGYPPVGRAQKVRIAEESLGASARAPLDSAAQVGGRTAERLIVRAREVTRHRCSTWRPISARTRETWAGPRANPPCRHA